MSFLFQAVIEALRDPSTNTRFSALCALSAFGDPTAIPYVRALLHDASALEGEGTAGELAARVLDSLTQTSQNG